MQANKAMSGESMTWRASLSNKVIIITGAGKGLGRAYAKYLANFGAVIIVNNRWRDRGQPSSADQVVDEINASGGRALASLHPVEETSSGEEMVSMALKKFGRLDGVIANAGVPEAKSFGRMSLSEFRSVFDVNFMGTLYVVHAAWKTMMAQKYGRVIVSTSSAGLHGNRGMSAYSSSKAALIGLTRALALEGGAANVKINAIAPYAATSMTEAYIDAQLAKSMTPEAVAPVIGWLISEACDVTGQIYIAGAAHLRRAWMAEGPIVSLKDDVSEALRKSGDAEPYETFDNANAAFQAFITRSPTV
jgi:NAD(P)-dependent dehydrogenase (short-subunit alcohol dehydrogenase family)